MAQPVLKAEIPACEGIIMKSLFFLFFGTVFHRGLAEFYCVFSRCERLNFDQFPGRDLIVLCAFCVVLGSAVSLPDATS
jgi:hypothetical protein